VDFPEKDSADPESAKTLNRFNYDGAKGNACPLAAHIRKTNQRKPRDLNEKSTFQTRIIRSGITYGSEFDESDEKRREKRGLLFACYQSSIEKGFKFIQSNWSNDANFPTSGAGHDPIIGQTPNHELSMNLGGPPISFKEMVTLKGGEYFFVPSIKALREKLGQD
jgi:deferrochelatase/peroxidase EfeB